ncbi:MAG: hypothetical protein QM755_02250 [Luteolibacter sp.]
MTWDLAVARGRWFLLLAAILQVPAFFMPISRLDFVGWAGRSQPVVTYLAAMPGGMVAEIRSLLDYRQTHQAGDAGLAEGTLTLLASGSTLLAATVAFLAWHWFKVPGRHISGRRFAIVIVAIALLWSLYIGSKPMPRGVLRKLQPGYWLYLMSLGSLFYGLLRLPWTSAPQPALEESALPANDLE